MINRGKNNVVGIMIDAVDYDSAVERILDKAHRREPLSVTALAVHGVMTGVLDPEHRFRLNSLDLVLPDGQPVRWALNSLHNARLPERVYGPTLMLKVCQRAAAEGVSVFLFGGTPSLLEALQSQLQRRFPNLQVAGSRASAFRRWSPEERTAVAQEINASGARIVFIGLGCPRQEVWAYEMRELLPMPLLAVGAAFNFHAGLLPQAPPQLQRLGLEWLFRFVQEPRRLWRRYVYLNPLYVFLLIMQRFGLRRFSPHSGIAPQEELLYG